MARSTAEDTDRTVVWLGNRNAVEVVDDPDADPPAEGQEPRKIRRKIAGAPKKNCTRVVVAEGATLMEAAVHITDPARGVWQAHSDAPAPAWVASTDPALAGLLASHWGCELRDPDPDHASGDATGGDADETEG